MKTNDISLATTVKSVFNSYTAHKTNKGLRICKLNIYIAKQISLTITKVMISVYKATEEANVLKDYHIFNTVIYEKPSVKIL